jgi:WhiB family redox-sensing transcriptional regulator
MTPFQGDGAALIDQRSTTAHPCRAAEPDTPLPDPAEHPTLHAQSRRTSQPTVHTPRGEPTDVLPCHVGDPELWFANLPEHLEYAKALCSGCPVHQRCLAGALERKEPHGVWGGHIVVDGEVTSHKRTRGRPRKDRSRHIDYQNLLDPS